MTWVKSLTAVQKTIELIPIRVSPVSFFSHLGKLSQSKATVLDNVCAKIIGECGNPISISSCDLFNYSLVFGILFDDLKRARILPLFKLFWRFANLSLLFLNLLRDLNN